MGGETTAPVRKSSQVSTSEAQHSRIPSLQNSQFSTAPQQSSLRAEAASATTATANYSNTVTSFASHSQKQQTYLNSSTAQPTVSISTTAPHSTSQTWVSRPSTVQVSADGNLGASAAMSTTTLTGYGANSAALTSRFGARLLDSRQLNTSAIGAPLNALGDSLDAGQAFHLDSAQNTKTSSGIVNISGSQLIDATASDAQNAVQQSRMMIHHQQQQRKQYQDSSEVRREFGEPRETVKTVYSYLDYDNKKVTENVIRREVGEARVISVTERVDESRVHVISERFVEHSVKVPKRVTRETIVERTMVVPEKIMTEEIVDELRTVKEKIIEYARPQIREKVVETPEYVYQERTVNVTEKKVEERPVYVDKVIKEERIVEKPKIITREKVVEVPVIEQRDAPYETQKVVNEVVDEVRTTEVVVPRYVDVPVPQVKEVESAVDVKRTLPVCVESETTCEIKVGEIKPRFKTMTYPVYLPKFIEVPMAVELMNGTLQSESSQFIAQINGLTKTAASLCDIENLASNIMRHDHNATAQSLTTPENLQAAVMQAWNSGSIQTAQNITATTTTTTAAAASTSQMHYQATTVGNSYTVPVPTDNISMMPMAVAH